MKFPGLILNILLYLTISSHVLAISDPLAVPNNKIGIHILFPDEVESASKLVNNDRSGAWGYVVVPIQSTDRDHLKWQKFMDNCQKLQVIPIIRVATTATGPHWDPPNEFDLLDFSNFLNDLKWPTQNRYIIFFNEVNRADEFGGEVSPEKYADSLNLAIDIFKSKSEDFFILPAGLDNAASDKKTSLKWNLYLDRMHQRRPDIFNKIDGWVSHAYPNPDFSARPDLKGENKINSFETDLAYLKKYTSKNLPVFITETGWSNKYLSDHQISLYYQFAFDKVWNHPQIVTVAPFLLNAQDGPFKQFSFLDENHNLKEFAAELSSRSTRGEPKIPIVITSTITPEATTPAVLSYQTPEVPQPNFFQKLYNKFKSLFGFI